MWTQALKRVVISILIHILNVHVQIKAYTILVYTMKNTIS